MIKVIYLIGIVWNGGNVGDGVLSRVYTFNTMPECQASLPQLERSAREQFGPNVLQYVKCVEVEMGGSYSI